MNKKSIILAVSALAIIVSCNVREDALPLPQKTVFKAVMADAPPTKTALQSNGAVFWTPGDAINLFYGDAVSTKMVFDSSATAAVAQASFVGSLPAGFSPSGTDDFWAVYPYSKDNSFDGSTVTLTLPDEQYAEAGTFADDLFISLARSTGYELSFYNLCGGIKFSVANQGIQYVIFRGLNEEFLAGQVQVTFNAEGKPVVQQGTKGVSEIRLNAPDGKEFEVGKWYYIVSLPAELTTGYMMTFYGQNDEMVYERFSENPVTIKRAVWGRLTEADKVAESVSASKYLTFSSRGTTMLSLSNEGGNAPVLYYSIDAQNWAQWDYSALTVSANAPLYMCGDNPQGFGTGISSFRMSGDNVAVSGDIMSLINKDQAVTVIPSASCFYGLFYQCAALVSAPELPATTLTEYCYYNMFYGCSGLIEAPELPATVLAPWCYGQMFAACTSLVTAPSLPAETLVNACYYHMFQNSTSLAYVQCMAIDISAEEATTTWLEDVASQGTFVKAPNTQWPINTSGIPQGWTVENAQ